MKKFMKLFAILFSLTLSIQAELNQEEIERSIVKIYTVAKYPNYLEPWNSTISRSNG